MEGLDVSDIERMSGAAPRPPLARRSYSEVPAGSPDESPEEKRPRTSVDLSGVAVSSRFWGDDGAAVVSDEGEEMVGRGSGSEEEEDDDDDDDTDDDDGDDDDGEEEEMEDRLAIFGHR